MITIGVLSDTHLLEPDKWFRKQAALCFADADMIFHAGDLISLSVLDVFCRKNCPCRAWQHVLDQDEGYVARQSNY